MPLSPTPLSGCPLRRLEIHDGSTCTVYDALQSDSSLTATLEARRSTIGNKNDLMLQFHLGINRVLSIQLTDLIKSTYKTTKIITINKPSQKMRIQIHQQKLNVMFIFQESLNFNTFVYTLKKFGFRVKDDVTFSSHASATNLARSQSYPVSSIKDVAPRLSSITPLETPGSLQAQSPFSFTSMLNSEVPLTEMQSLGTGCQQTTLQDLSQQSEYQVAPVTTYALYQSPYQLYLNHHDNTYRPRVSSPLRNAVEMNSRDTSPISSVPNSHSSFLSNATATGPLLNSRSISEPDSLLKPWQQRERMGTNNYESASSQESSQASQDTAACTGNDSQTTDESDIPSTLQATQDFRELMPRARNLPFVKDSKSKASRSKHVKKRANTEYSQSKINSSIFIEENLPPDSDSDSASTSQISLRPTSSQSIDTQTEVSPTCHLSYDGDDLPSMLIAHSGLLEKLNEITSRLLDQYNADLDRGCDSSACAQFYLEQIDTARREFWLDQLKQSNYM